MSLSRRGRRRIQRRPDNATEVFKTFVSVLARMHAGVRGDLGEPAQIVEKS